MKQNLFLLALASLAVFFSCTDEDPTANQKPEACFNLSPIEGKVGDRIGFTNCSKNAQLFVWSFGDGNSSTQKEPEHIFQKQGRYEIKLLSGKDKNQDGVLNILDDPDSTIKIIEIKPNHLAVELTIYSATGWTPENPQLTVASGATIFLYKNFPSTSQVGEPDYTLTSNENGKVFLYDMDVIAEYYVVKKDNESNIVDGYLVDGVFQTQEELDNAAFQNGAKVGGLKYVDINGDGIITQSDQTTCAPISISQDKTLKKDVIIGK